MHVLINNNNNNNTLMLYYTRRRRWRNVCAGELNEIKKKKPSNRPLACTGSRYHLYTAAVSHGDLHEHARALTLFRIFFFSIRTYLRRKTLYFNRYIFKLLFFHDFFPTWYFKFFSFLRRHTKFNDWERCFFFFWKFWRPTIIIDENSYSDLYRT